MEGIHMTSKPKKVLYTAHATATGGREGSARTDTGELDVKLTSPKELGGSGAAGVNPEQMFAAGYAACFLSAMKLAASEKKLQLADNSSIDASVGIGPHPSGKGFALEVNMDVHTPGLEKDQAEEIINLAHQLCPYSHATRGNIEVNFRAV